MKKGLLLNSALAALIALVAVLGGGARQAASPGARVDAILSRWDKSTPGCAAGVSQKGVSVLQKAYGMADLEHEVPNKPDTIFEAGSVSKQFTAAAILLLAKDGKLSVDDPARKYLPELPDYGVPLTIRHMLTHTSGLRDWGSVVAVTGWPRTTRVHTHAHVLDVVSRQKALNFTPGTRWSYSNTGYNLAAIIVSRVSGQSFASFTHDRIFQPLGMTRTSWRDDYTRIVKDRAIAYENGRDGYSSDMPFENVHGNGGLLTTVGDLLRWTRNHLSQPVVGDAAFVKDEQEPGRFTDGRKHDYAFGLRVASYRTVREVSHSGATAGYRAYLATYPDQQVAVAVLCNAGNANATQIAHEIADGYLGLAPQTAAASTNGGRGQTAAPANSRDAIAGTYLSTDNGQALTLVRDGADLRMGSLTLIARSPTQYSATNGPQFDFSPDGRLTVTDEFGTTESFSPVRTDEAPKSLADYAGMYSSDEAEVTMIAAMDGDSLVLKRRPDSVLRLTAAYPDTFRSPIGVIRFRRDASRRVTGFSVSQDRVWDLRFERR
jgi:CubicO group peptidase (beta-lactamase class C family)